MPVANIFFAAICWLCSMIFGGIAFWAFKRKDPMHFWSGSTVKPEEITDIPSYNRANGCMWAVYTVFVVVAGIFSLFNITIGAILLGIICLPGIGVLVLSYNRIYKKYKSTSVTYKTEHFKSQTPNTIIVAVILISVISLILIATLFTYGEKDPGVSILDNRIQIKAMYGINIEFSEIVDVSLIEKSMRDIGIGRRTNGYGGFGETLKGNFSSDTHGATLLFVQSMSSPTLKIERAGKKDVYISFRNSEYTEQLYLELIAAIPLK